MNDLELAGCRPVPLLSYLKALGVFRLVAEQADPDARACWRGDTFFLGTDLDQAGLERFFLEDYRPTPIVAPWNGGSGFFPNDKKGGIRAVSESREERFAGYREALVRAEQVAQRELGGRKPSGPTGKREKLLVLRACRAELPDEAVDWLDAVYALAADARSFAP